jgi:hypothetical protein
MMFKLFIQLHFNEETFEKEVEIPFIPYKGLCIDFGSGEKFDAISAPVWSIKRNAFISSGWKFIGLPGPDSNWTSSKKAELISLGWKKAILSS